MVKCVVWDLDNTIWRGTLLEDAEVTVREGVAEAVALLDSRGILQSVASRNDAKLALTRLREAGLGDYFLVPQIGWGAKSRSVARIAELLGIGLDTVLLVDDDAFERAEVRRAWPQARTVDAAQPGALPGRADLNPAVVTREAGRRRLMYLAQQRRTEVEESFTGPPEEFLASLGLRLVLRRAEPGDLARAEELTVRTNQLNATGRTYSAAELDAFRDSPGYRLLVATLSDRFGDYGTIGLMLLETRERAWTLRLLLISCRVLSRGVGAILLGALVARAKEEGVRLLGEFVPTRSNRPMLITYRFTGFERVSERDGVTLFEHRSPAVPARPAYVDFVSEL